MSDQHERAMLMIELSKSDANFINIVKGVVLSKWGNPDKDANWLNLVKPQDVGDAAMQVIADKLRAVIPPPIPTKKEKKGKDNEKAK